MLQRCLSAAYSRILPPPLLPIVTRLGAGSEDGQLLRQLQDKAMSRLQQAFAPRSQGPLKSALKAFERFAAACPQRELFRRPRGLGDPAAASHNEWTLILFATYLASTTSERTRRVVSTDTIRSYISMLKGYYEHTFAFELVTKGTRLKRFLESLEGEDKRSGQRRRRRALRKKHLLRMWDQLPALRRPTPKAVNEHAIISTAWHTLARGGEVARLMRSDLHFRRLRGGKRYAVVWLWPLKKRVSAHTPKIPQYILEHDGGGADTYRALRRLVKFDPVPDEERENTPMFRLSGSRGRRSGFTTAKLLELVRRRMRQIGEDKPREWSAHSPRIGGATDLASTGKLCQVTLQAKGRWASDIGKIYARGTRLSQLKASQLMQQGRGRDLEEIFPGYSQPA